MNDEEYQALNAQMMQYELEDLIRINDLIANRLKIALMKEGRS